MLVAALVAAVVGLPVIGGQQAAVRRPAHPTNRVVVYVHGAGETATDSLARTKNSKLVARLLRDGYAVATSTAHGDNWGTERSVEDYVALVRWLRARGLTRVYVLAESMGGFDGLELIDRVHPKAWAALYPACDLPSLTDPLLVPGIRAAHPWGLPRGLSPVRPRRLRGLRMMFWASPQDTRVPKASNTDMCAAYARSRGARVRVVTTHGEHGDWSNFQPDRLARFFRSAASPGTR